MRYKIKGCEYCGKLAHCKRRFCSLECYRKWLVGKSNLSNTKFQKGHIPYNKGKEMSEEKYEKLKMAGFFEPKFGEKSGNWKGGITITKEKLNERCKYYRQKPEYKLKHRIYQSKRVALLNSTDDGTITRESIENMLIEQNHKCNKCGIELDKYHIDHIIPPKKGGRHTISNIQLLCPKCNILKSDTIENIVHYKSSLIDLEAQKWATGRKVEATVND